MEYHHIAAHRVADALRVIAENLPKLSAQASDPIYDLLEGQIVDDCGWHVTCARVADRVAATAPFTPLTDDERQALFEEVYEDMGDLSSKDHAHTYMNMAEWQLRVEKDERDEYMQEEDEC